MESSINVFKSGGGSYFAEKTVGSIKISCNNTSTTAVTDEARNMLRIVEEAIRKGWFPVGTNKIGVVGKANTEKGPVDRWFHDQKRLTVNVGNVKFTGLGAPPQDLRNLYLLPHNSTSEVTDTTGLKDTDPYDVTRLAG